MAIKILDDRIEIGNFSLKETSDGLRFTGIAKTVANESITLFQGTVAGYTSGGFNNTPPTPTRSKNIVDKFPFATDANATDVGDLTQARDFSSGQSSTTHGYTCGGNQPPTPVFNTIDRFPFATNANATDVGDHSVDDSQTHAGQSSETHGYHCAQPPSTPVGDSVNKGIQKFPFAVATTNAVNVGGFSEIRNSGSGISSTTHGYIAGGSPPAPSNPPSAQGSATVSRFPFATDVNATNVSSLQRATGGSNQGTASQSSITHGYVTGGASNSPPSPSVAAMIQKFPFALEGAVSSIVTSINSPSSEAAGQSSMVSGYSSGGSGESNTIAKFPFSTDSISTDVGDLTLGRSGGAGQQD